VPLSHSTLECISDMFCVCVCVCARVCVYGSKTRTAFLNRSMDNRSHPYYPYPYVLNMWTLLKAQNCYLYRDVYAKSP
jgi:hypothetical protein